MDKVEMANSVSRRGAPSWTSARVRAAAACAAATVPAATVAAFASLQSLALAMMLFGSSAAAAFVAQAKILLKKQQLLVEAAASERLVLDDATADALRGGRVAARQGGAGRAGKDRVLGLERAMSRGFDLLSDAKHAPKIDLHYFFEGTFESEPCPWNFATSVEHPPHSPRNGGEAPA